MSGGPNAQDHDEEMRRTPAADESGLAWHRPEPPAQLSGFWWHRQDGLYRRLPVDPVAPLSGAVDSLANWTAGARYAFAATAGASLCAWSSPVGRT